MGPVGEWLAASGLEAIAVILAIAYLILAVRENIWCWACAFVSTAIYIYLFYDVALLSESALNVFYLLMAVYGWRQWRRGSRDHLEIGTWPWRRHAAVIATTAAVVPLLGWYMDTQLGAALPYADAFTTCFAVVSTYMVARKILENWLYWFIIDSVSIYLYLAKGLHLTAALFGLYLVLIVVGWARWLRVYRAQTSVAERSNVR